MRALLAAGEPVRALVRDSKAPLPVGAEAVVGDLNEPDTFTGALDGVDGVFLLSGYRNIEQTLANARRAGVARIVLLSSSAAPGGDMSNAVARYHILSERAVRASGLPWTFLQPNSFMTNVFRWLPQLRSGDEVRLPFPEVRVATIDPDDIGAVAVAVFAGDGHEGRSYRLSGPESLLPEGQVATVARVLGRVVRFVPQSDEEARAEMGRTMPLEYVDAFMSFFADGTVDESEILPTVERITGRPPRTMARWAEAHVVALQRAATGADT
jgi:uncharacterized protein YbjT (DUF2867 family)